MKNQWIKIIKKAPIKIKNDIVIERLINKSVLDIGCIGQDINYSSDEWLHGKLKKKCRVLTGVDINNEGIKNFKLLNPDYDIRTPDELISSGDKFDIIVMADVIEHVDNVVDFVNFYKQFLNPEGEIIITTPNPFSINQSFNILLIGLPAFHPEHTCYIDPINMLEVIERTKLNFEDFYWLKNYTKPKKFYQKIMLLFSLILMKLRPYYSPNYFIAAKLKRTE